MFVILIKIAPSISAPRTEEVKKKKGGEKQANKKGRKTEMIARLSCTPSHGLLTFD